MLTIEMINDYYRARGCTCANAPVKPGDEHDSDCALLFIALGIRERLKRLRRILLALNPRNMGRGFGRAGLWRGGRGSVGRVFARRIRRFDMGSGCLGRCAGGVFLRKRFLINGGAA